jgi:serine protease Do
LLKSDTIGNAALMLEKEMSANVGEEVLAVGSPVSMSLAQTLTSGIISSKHKVNELDYFQTDVRISRGGNGSPLVNKKGLLIGIVNEKYVEPGVEGISFAVSSADILKRLKLTYSN